MTVIKKFVSILLAASLCIGSIFSVQGDNAFYADAYQSTGITSGYIDELLSSHSNESGYQNAYSLLHGSYWNVNYLCVFTYLDDDNWNFTVWRVSSYNSGHPALQWQINPNTDAMKPYPSGYGYLQYSYIFVQNGTLNSVNYQLWRMTDRTFNPGSTPVIGSACGVNDQVVNSSTYQVYFSNDIYTGDSASVMSESLRYAANLSEQWGPPAPPDPISYDLIRFNLGERVYLTTSDQSIIRGTDPDTEDYSWGLGFMKDEVSTLVPVTYNDLSLLKGAEYFIDVSLSNISPLGVYAYDITDRVYDSIFYSKFLIPWYGEMVPLYEASNVPLNFNDGPGDNVSSLDQAWTQISYYYSTYNTTQVVPQSLGDELFGLTGSQCAACWVSLPSTLIYQGNTSPMLDTIQWGFNDLSPSIDWSLMDVLIYPAGYSEARVDYYYNSTFSPEMVTIDRFAFSNLLNMYDVIIVVDPRISSPSDPSPFAVTNAGNLLARAFTGLSGGGVDFVDSSVSDWPSDQTFHGYCFITKKAVQKQLLFNFNDGCRKTYDLMSQYIDKQSDWDNSFLLWSASVFDMLNSIDGRLDPQKVGSIGWFLSGDIKLSDYLDNILDKLDNLVNNTSVDEVDPGSWFPSLWRFINRFSIQDSTFANWLDDLDDFYDDLPDLPELQPTIIPFPTYIPEPTAGAG